VGVRGLARYVGAVALGLFSAALLSPGEASAQITWQDLVFTGGLSLEAYEGNLAAVTVPAVDSTDQASAVVGEIGARGSLYFTNRQERAVRLQWDAGLRQFAAGGFQLRDYAPTELVGRVDMSFRESVSTLGELWFFGGIGGRRVDDRPPMPLFLQPAHGTVDGRVLLQLYQIGDVYYDVQVFGELADYSTTPLTPQLALLDRWMLGGEAGATWGSEGTLRVHAGFRRTKYGNQGTFDPSDPLRRDNTLNLGATWSFEEKLIGELAVEGTVNRSNSNRPEYNAVSLRAEAFLPLPLEFNLNFFALLTAKQYLEETDYAQLVPGEEADNASVVYLEASRPLMTNLDGALRFGWNRAETDIGDSYYERFGATVLFRYRPWR
jgi:hypothetical protein